MEVLNYWEQHLYSNFSEYIIFYAGTVFLGHLVFKDYSALGVRYRDLQARVYKQKSRNLTLYEAQPRAVLNFEILVCKRVLINPDNAPTKSAANVLIFSLSKPLKQMHFNYPVKIVKL